MANLTMNFSQLEKLFTKILEEFSTDLNSISVDKDKFITISRDEYVMTIGCTFTSYVAHLMVVSKYSTDSIISTFEINLTLHKAPENFQKLSIKSVDIPEGERLYIKSVIKSLLENYKPNQMNLGDFISGLT